MSPIFALKGSCRSSCSPPASQWTLSAHFSAADVPAHPADAEMLAEALDLYQFCWLAIAVAASRSVPRL